MRHYTPKEAKRLLGDPWLLVDLLESMGDQVDECDDGIIVTFIRREHYYANGELAVLTDVLHTRDGVIDVYDIWSAQDLGEGTYKLLDQLRIETDEWENVKASDLLLVRSDQGDGGWSLHPPGADFSEEGNDIILASGEADWDDEADDWDRPNEADYAAALAALTKLRKR
jgi:hypothetical protein